MKKNLIVLLWFAMTGISPVIAQNELNSFKEFRNEISGNFQSFRKKMLEDYDKYLEGIWKEYHAFKGEERNPTPKPRQAPILEGAKAPQHEPSDSKSSPQKEAIPENIHPNELSFYGLNITIPGIEKLNHLPQGNSQEDYAKLWKIFSRQQIEKQILPTLLQTANKCNFNDWFTFELIRAYIDQTFADSTSGIRISLSHYLLTHAGYNVRLGLDENKIPILLVAFEQKVFARSYCSLNNTPYYIFNDSQDENKVTGKERFYTCDIPTNIDCGRKLDLLIQKDIIMPFQPTDFTFSHNSLTIKGTLNANVIRMLYHYPQMPIECYAKSVINNNLRKDIVNQFKTQLRNLPHTTAIDTILQFVQYAFRYATDDEQHGFEKPYFFEETLFYPQCDCEDRSVFYSYLLWEVLNAENHLIGFPGHECVAVYLNSSLNGDGYNFNNKTFYISDPTYIGATTGMCMPDFRNSKPEIKLTR